MASKSKMCSLRAIIIMAAAVIITQSTLSHAAPPPKLVIGTSKDVAFRELFDKPDLWSGLRPRVGGLLHADHSFTPIADADLQRWFDQMNQWGISLELEVGVIKDWGKTANLTFATEAPIWDRLTRLHAKTNSIVMDEPLAATRFSLHLTDEYAVEETARFIGMVRQKYPDLEIGDIEVYPGMSLADNMNWIASLQKRLKELNIKPLDFYRLDVDWAAFGGKDSEHWNDVKKLEDYCHTVGLPFSLIYWAADYPLLKQAGTANDESWYKSLMSQGSAYSKTGAVPDQYVIESWVGSPKRGVPETDKSAFTGSALDFSNRFIH